MAPRLHLQTYQPAPAHLRSNVPRHTTVAPPMHAAEGNWSPSTRRGYDYLLTSAQVPPSSSNHVRSLTHYMPLVGLVPSIISGVQTIHRGLSNEQMLSQYRVDIQQQAELLEDELQHLHTIPNPPLPATEAIERWVQKHKHQFKTAAAIFKHKIKDEQFKIASAALELGTITAICLPTIQTICAVSLGIGLSLCPVANLIPALFTIHGVLHIRKHATKLYECFQLRQHEKEKLNGTVIHANMQIAYQNDDLFLKSLTNQLIYLTAQTIFWLSFTIGVLAVSHFVCAQVLSLLHATILLFIGATGTTILQFSIFNQQHAVPANVETVSSKIAANDELRADMLQHLLNIEKHTQLLERQIYTSWGHPAQNIHRLFTQHLLHLPHVARIFSKILSYFKLDPTSAHQGQTRKAMQACVSERQTFIQEQVRLLANKEKKSADIVEKMRQYFPTSPMLETVEVAHAGEKQESELLSALLVRYNHISELLKKPNLDQTLQEQIAKAWHQLDDPFWGTRELFFTQWEDLLVFNHIKASNDRYTLLWIEQFVRSYALKTQCGRQR